MEKARIQDLLEKYFQGATSLEEEVVLRKYFADTQQVEAEFKVHAPLFQYLEVAKARSYSGTTLPELPKIRTMHNRYRIAVATAAVLVGLCVATFLWKSPTPAPTAQIDWSKYELTDEQLAAEQTVAALKLLASKLNGGAKKAAQEMDRIDNINTVFSD